MMLRTQGYYILVGWTLWFALLGYQLARGDRAIESANQGLLAAAGRLALVAFLWVVHTLERTPTLRS